VKLKLVGLLTAERISAIDSRRIDVLIATLSDTPERRQRLTLVTPHYYASGVNILSPKESGFKRWEELRNRRICGRRGAFYNRPIMVDYGADIIALYSNDLAAAALRDGRCAGFLYDDTGIITLLKDAVWSRHYEMPLPTLYVTPWSIALHRSEREGRLATAISAAIVDWHRSGLIVELERKWGIPVSAYTARMNARWNQRVDGVFFCGDRITPATPESCH